MSRHAVARAGVRVRRRCRALQWPRSATSAAASRVRSEAGPKAARLPGCRFRLRPLHYARRRQLVQRAPNDARHTLPPVRESVRHRFGSYQIRGRRGEATPASCLAAAAAPDAPRTANRRAALEPRRGLMRRRGRFSRARAAKPANPSASPSTASLRRASAVPSSMISRGSVLPSVLGSLTRSVAAFANFNDF